MFKHIFYVPILQIECEDWNNKKNILKSNEINFAFKDTVHTDYFEFSKKQTNVEKIFENELKIFSKEFELNKLEIAYSWFEKSKKYNYHPPHNHGFGLYSAVCYVDYDEQEHKPINFICPFLNFVDGTNLEYVPQNVKEGTIIFFPAALSHYTMPNLSNKDRLVFSFNIHVS